MIANVFLDKSNSNEVSKKFIQYLLQLDALNYLKHENIIDEKLYDKTKVCIKNLHIG